MKKKIPIPTLGLEQLCGGLWRARTQLSSSAAQAWVQRGGPGVPSHPSSGWAAFKLSVKMAWVWLMHFSTTRQQWRVKLMQAGSSRIREIWLWYLNRDLDGAEAGLKQLSHNKIEWLNRAAKAFSLTPLSLASRGTNMFYFLRLTSYLRKKWPSPPGMVRTNLVSVCFEKNWNPGGGWSAEESGEF